MNGRRRRRGGCSSGNIELADCWIRACDEGCSEGAVEGHRNGKAGSLLWSPAAMPERGAKAMESVGGRRSKLKNR